MRGKAIVRGPKGPGGPQGPEGPAGPAGEAGPTGAATARLYVEETLVAESAEISLAGSELVAVVPDSMAQRITVALPRGFVGAPGPVGPVGPEGRQGPQGAEGPQGAPGTSTVLRSVTAAPATLAGGAGNQVMFALSCPPGSFPVAVHYTAVGPVEGSSFIEMQSFVDLESRVLILTLTRSSTAVDAEIAPQAICITGTAL